MPRPIPTCYRLLSALLALLVLATSVGLTAERHRCRISGRSTVALRLPGLGPHKQAPRKSCVKRRADGCCDISHVLHKLDAKQHASGAAKYLAAPLLAPALPPALAWAGRHGGQLAAGITVGQAANSSPPGVPRAGRTLLTLIHTLVV